MVYNSPIFKLFLHCVVLICLMCFTSYAQQQEKSTIKGTVVTQSGIPIPYASVLLKGTGYGTTTNEQGVFDFKAPAGSYTLLVSYIGYEKYEIQLQIKKGGNAPV